MPQTRWDERYSVPGYAYGTEPDEFLRSVLDRLPVGRVLTIGEGEGRNAVFLARRGFDVTALDASRVGLTKAEALADANSVRIHTVEADLADFVFEPGAWDVIVSIWVHLPPALRRRVHGSIVTALRPGGAVVLEAYTPDQIGRGTGGPPREELMMTADMLREDFAGLEPEMCVETERDVVEGRLHTGLGAVVQLLAFKSA